LNSFGRLFRINIFGESHGESAGVNIDGCPAGLSLSVEDFMEDLERRKGGTQKGTTPRKEDDIPIFKSGVFNGKTTGAPITILFENKNTRSGDYEKQRAVPRPGHADFVAHAKFGGYEDFRGGGHFSGRLTVCLVAVGVIAKKLLDLALTPDLTPGPSPKERGMLAPDEPGYITNTLDQWISVSNHAKENRKQPTEEENILWQALRNRNLEGYKFRRQHPIAGYIPDFVCLERKLMVEIDGGYHNMKEQKEFDEQRTQWLNEHGYRMIRFTNEEVKEQLAAVLRKLGEALSLPTGQAGFGEGLGEVEQNHAGIKVVSSILEIGGEKDLDKGLQKAIDQKDSIGGIVECRVNGLPVGLGEPFFDSVESLISHAVFAIPAIRGIEFGTGFAAAGMFGVEHNDAIEDKTGKTKTNHAGGVVGGITNSNELVFRIAVKPTSSTPKEQQTLNWETGLVESFSVKGRHDLCIALRVPVVLEAVTAMVLVDLLMQEQHIKRVL
jgi:chorismate synthase/very-short-patch-repair endonuclease